MKKVTKGLIIGSMSILGLLNLSVNAEEVKSPEYKCHHKMDHNSDFDKKSHHKMKGEKPDFEKMSADEKDEFFKKHEMRMEKRLAKQEERLENFKNLSLEEKEKAFKENKRK